MDKIMIIMGAVYAWALIKFIFRNFTFKKLEDKIGLDRESLEAFTILAVAIAAVATIVAPQADITNVVDGNSPILVGILLFATVCGLGITVTLSFLILALMSLPIIYSVSFVAESIIKEADRRGWKKVSIKKFFTVENILIFVSILSIILAVIS